MKKLTSFVVAMVMICAVQAQERYFDERYISSHAFVNPVLVNPGATGKDYYHHLLVNYRSLWAGFDGAPRSFGISYDGPLKNNIGVGAMLITDQAGILDLTKGQASFSYTIASPTNKIGIGLGVEYLSHGLSNDIMDDELVEDDIYLDARAEGASYFGGSFGVYGKYNNQIIYGFSLPSLFSSRITSRAATPATGYSDTNFGYIVHAGYIFRPASSDMEVEPSIFYKGLSNVPSHIDINVLMRFIDEKFTGGVTYTVGADERLGFLLGARVNSFNFYYSYNISRNDFQVYNNGSHEFTIRLDIGRKEGTEAKMLEMGEMQMKEEMGAEMDDTKMRKDKNDSEIEKSKKMLQGKG